MTDTKIFSLLNDVIILLFIFLAIFSFKGFFQTLIAKIMGDNTATDEGFLTMNPLVHVDLAGLCTILGVYFVVGLIFAESLPYDMLFVLLVAFGARMIIQVPIDEHNFRNYKLGGILTSLAGAIGNFLLAFCSMILMKIMFSITLPGYVLVTFLKIIKAIINTSLLFGLLNLMPLPPFDGGRMLRYIIPYSRQYIVSFLEDYSFFILLILFFAPGISDMFFGTLSSLRGYIKEMMFLILF